MVVNRHMEAPICHDACSELLLLACGPREQSSSSSSRRQRWSELHVLRLTTANLTLLLYLFASFDIPPSRSQSCFKAT